MSRRLVLVSGLIVLAALVSAQPVGTQRAPTVVLFEGARLIPGDGSAAIEGSALLVEDGTITRIGRKGAFTPPAGAARIDLTGKTVMPAIINAHGHPGFQKGLTYSAANFTRQTIIEDLNRALYFGVAAVQSQGIERGDVMFQIRAEQAQGRLGGARLLVAGRGLGAPNAGPGAEAYKDIAYEVTTEEDARRSVREQAAKNVDAIKVWVDDRNGRAPRMSPLVFRAIVDEGHRQGLRVAAHIYYHTDAMALAEAGIDGFAHLVRDKEMDAALVRSIVEHNIYAMGNLSSSQRSTYAALPPWLQDGDPMMTLLRATTPPEVIERMKASYAKRDPAALERSRRQYGILQRSLARLNAAGARLTLGADTGVEDHLFGLAEHRELEEMVKAGMTPGQGIVAATSRPAEYMRLTTMGSLVPGKEANLLVLDANPLDDITNTRRIARVYIKGAEVNREALRRGLTEGAAR